MCACKSEHVCICMCVRARGQVFAALHKFLRLVASREGAAVGEADGLFRRLQEEVRAHARSRTCDAQYLSPRLSGGREFGTIYANVRDIPDMSSALLRDVPDILYQMCQFM